MRTRRPLHALLLLISVLFPIAMMGQTASTPEAQRILDHVRTLSSDEFGGRAPGTPGNEKAAAYIEAAFKAAGLKPAGKDGGFRAPFSMPIGAALGPKNSVNFDVVVERPGVPLDMTKPTKISWKLGVDYQPYGWTESKTVTGKVVFAGYGITSPEGKYDDYAGIDVNGAVVIVLRGLPKWAERDDSFGKYASLRTKATTAREKGAVAVCFVNEQGDSSDVLSRFGLDRIGGNSGIVAVQVRRTPCARIFPPKETSLFVAEKQINTTKKPASFALTRTTGTITTDVSTELAVSWNVVGIVEGTDPALMGQYVVVGAHFDHLGMGDENSLAASTTPDVHHGADDNASGTAGVIELAARFAASRPKRSVLFMGFSGEEKGLLGSKDWVIAPTVPLSDIVAMVNLDMIGRLKDNKLNIQGYGTSPQWPEVIDSAKKDLGLTIATTTDGFGPSDHASFFAKNIPVLFFFTGLHTDYHRPTDTWEKINADGEVVVLTMVERAVRTIADRDDRVAFSKPAAQQTQSSSIALKVSLGVIPDYADDPNGLKITGVREGSAAQKAGLQADDVITRIGTMQIKNIYDLMASLGTYKPQDKADIVVLRQGKAVTMKVVFAGK
jgi:aminopeptidase YwaD